MASNKVIKKTIKTEEDIDSGDTIETVITITKNKETGDIIETVKKTVTFSDKNSFWNYKPNPIKKKKKLSIKDVPKVEKVFRGNIKFEEEYVSCDVSDLGIVDLLGGDFRRYKSTIINRIYYEYSRQQIERGREIEEISIGIEGPGISFLEYINDIGVSTRLRKEIKKALQSSFDMATVCEDLFNDEKFNIYVNFYEKEPDFLPTYLEETCVVCLVNKSCILFSPCGHISLCESCNRIDKCPVCRKESDRKHKLNL